MRNAALRALDEADPQRRLEGARALRILARVEDEERIRRALRRETVKWVRSELEDVLDLLSEQIQPEQTGEASETANSTAVRAMTLQLVHELRHFLARFQLALDELPEYEGSMAEREFDRMTQFIDSVFDLGTAAAIPKYSTFDLGSSLYQIAEDQAREVGADIDMAGPSSMLCVGDPRLLERIVANGLRNAVEASREVWSTRAISPVVINWGKTATEYWISVIDEGVGPPAGVRRLFRMGMSTKAGHMGMGLAIANQAIKTLGGQLSLSPRKENGACFEIRWPIRVFQNASSDS